MYYLTVRNVTAKNLRVKPVESSAPLKEAGQAAGQARGCGEAGAMAFTLWLPEEKESPTSFIFGQAPVKLPPSQIWTFLRPHYFQIDFSL